MKRLYIRNEYSTVGLLKNSWIALLNIAVCKKEGQGTKITWLPLTFLKNSWWYYWGSREPQSLLRDSQEGDVPCKLSIHWRRLRLKINVSWTAWLLCRSCKYSHNTFHVSWPYKHPQSSSHERNIVSIQWIFVLAVTMHWSWLRVFSHK